MYQGGAELSNNYYLCAYEIEYEIEAAELAAELVSGWCFILRGLALSFII
jgi:hypothetical protein